MNTGGPAFPSKYITGVQQNFTTGQNEFVYETLPGMTLRDYFAAQVISASYIEDACGDEGYARIARTAYKIADTMLAAREVQS